MMTLAVGGGVSGTNFCLPSQTTVPELFSVARDAGLVPDISLDPILNTFLSLDSRASLGHHYASLQRGMTGQQLAAFRHNLTSELGGGRVHHGGIGVVALALSLLFDIVARQVRLQGSGSSLVAEPLGHRFPPPKIFGISSTSRIGRIIESYLQQIPGIANNADKMAEMTELYDSLLKLELIDHYERMTNKKKRMSSESMREWLAGAAVHLHMRIHQVRLHSVPIGSAESLRLSYKTGFSQLVESYAIYLRRNIQETPAPGPIGDRGSQTSENRSNQTNWMSSTNLQLSKTKVAGSADWPTDKLNHTRTTDLNNQTNTVHGVSDVSGLVGHIGPKENVVASVNAKISVANISGGGSKSEEGASQGLLVIEPMRNVSHSVLHHPCESPAIEQAMAVRILEAQDLESSREFFLHSQKLFNALLRQSNDFDLRIKRRKT